MSQVDALEDVVRTYSTYFFTGAGLGAWDLWSQRCRSTTDEAEVVGAIAAFAELTGKLDNPMSSFSIDSISDSAATVTYDFERGDYGQSEQPWVLEKGSWRYDAC